MPAAYSIMFYAIAAAMVGVALAFVLPRLISRRGVDGGGSLAASNVAIHRSALADLVRERADGRLDEAQFREACDELSRRLLAEAPDDPPPRAPARTPPIAIAVALAIPVLAFALYALFGDPGALTDVRASQAAEAPDLERYLATHPRDARGYVLLARRQMQADRFDEASASYEKALVMSAKVAADANVWCEYADALGMAQGNSLAGKPSELIAKALVLDPNNARALEMAGSAAYERRDFASAARHWRQLLSAMPADAAARGELAAAIARTEQLAATSRAGG